MYLTDSIGDMLTRIRNAARVGDETVDIPASTVKQAIAQIFKDEGYVSKIESLTKRNKKVIRMTLKYGKKKKNIMTEIKRISKPGRRIYINRTEIPVVKSGFGIAIISTSKGIMTDGEARKIGLGGELLCQVW